VRSGFKINNNSNFNELFEEKKDDSNEKIFQIFFINKIKTIQRNFFKYIANKRNNKKSKGSKIDLKLGSEKVSTFFIKFFIILNLDYNTI